MKKAKIIKDQSSLGQFSSAIAQICDEKGIDKEKVVASIEAALAAAYKKDYGQKGQIIMAKIDEKTSETSFKRLREVVDETVRTIDKEEIPEEARVIPKEARKSEEKIEKRNIVLEDEEGNLPRFNPERDVLLVDAQRVVPDAQVGDFIEYPLEVKDEYGRIASQTAKQVIIQKIREAEREVMYEEFKGREGEVISGTVQRVEGGKVFIDLGKSVGVLFPSEQIPGENYYPGQRLRLYVAKVESDPRSLGIVLSRRHPQLLVKLFELEVPEIFSGVVEIKAVAREAGQRSKIAVSSNEEGIDPVGSCVGQKGTRVQTVIDELNGEKIDIVEWTDKEEEMIARALAPAKVVKVELFPEESKQPPEDLEAAKEETEKEADKSVAEGEEIAAEAEVNTIKKGEEDKTTEETEAAEEKKKGRAVVYVKEDQYSLAIGRRGQNVRLAGKLTGWEIDVEKLETDDEEPEETEEEGQEAEEAKEATQEKTEKTKEEKQESMAENNKMVEEVDNKKASSETVEKENKMENEKELEKRPVKS